MSISKAGLKAALLAAMDPDNPPANKEDAMDALADAIVTYLLDNLEVKIPIAGVVDTVSGGSGAPAVGIANLKTISCEVS